MRVAITEEIIKLMELITPYVRHTEEKGTFLSDDAPQEVIIARERIQKWAAENATRKF